MFTGYTVEREGTVSPEMSPIFLSPIGLIFVLHLESDSQGSTRSCEESHQKTLPRLETWNLKWCHCLNIELFSIHGL